MSSIPEIKNILKSGLPVLLLGDAGTGKSSILRALAKENQRQFVDLRVAMMPPEDLTGIPKTVGDEYFQYLAPEWAAKHAHNQGEDLLIIVEEIHLAPPQMHAALYQLLQEKEVAGVDLSKAWIASTGNPPEQAGAAYTADMPEALHDRLEVIKFKTQQMESAAFLKKLADDLGVHEKVQEACGLIDGLGLPCTPRSIERLLRLVAAGVTDETLIARRAGNATSAVLAALKQLQKETGKEKDNSSAFTSQGFAGDILSRVTTQMRAQKHNVFTSEGFVEDNG